MDYRITESRINQLIDECYTSGLTPIAEDLEKALANLRYAKDNGYVS